MLKIIIVYVEDYRSHIYIYYCYSLIVSAKEGWDLMERFLLSLNFESIDKYYQGTDVLHQSMKLVFSKTSSERNEMGFFQTS